MNVYDPNWTPIRQAIEIALKLGINAEDYPEDRTWERPVDIANINILGDYYLAIYRASTYRASTFDVGLDNAFIEWTERDLFFFIESSKAMLAAYNRNGLYNQYEAGLATDCWKCFSKHAVIHPLAREMAYFMANLWRDDRLPTNEAKNIFLRDGGELSLSMSDRAHYVWLWMKYRRVNLGR